MLKRLVRCLCSLAALAHAFAVPLHLASYEHHDHGPSHALHVLEPVHQEPDGHGSEEPGHQPHAALDHVVITTAPVPTQSPSLPDCDVAPVLAFDLPAPRVAGHVAPAPDAPPPKPPPIAPDRARAPPPRLV